MELEISYAALIGMKRDPRPRYSQRSEPMRFRPTIPPALPDTPLAAAQTQGRERYEGFVEALGRRLARGRKLADEVSGM